MTSPSPNKKKVFVTIIMSINNYTVTTMCEKLPWYGGPISLASPAMKFDRCVETVFFQAVLHGSNSAHFENNRKHSSTMFFNYKIVD